MEKIIILVSSYKPNTAPTNRLLSYLRGFLEQGVKTDLVFVYPSEASDRLENHNTPQLCVKYLWDKYRCRNKIYKYIRSFIDVKRWVHTLPSGAVVFLYGSSEYLSILARRRDIKLYQERTEHPDANPLVPSFMQKKYLTACRKLTGMFVISTKLKSVYESLGVDNVSIVNMLVDPNRFVGIEKQQIKDKYIAYCGTASNNKDGVDRLIKAFAIVHKQHPNIKLFIMGKAPTKDDASGNLNLVKDLGLNESVTFTGVIQSKDMPQMLKNAEVLALARPDSIQAQCGFPTKLGEYLLTENPVVVTRVGDIPLFLQDGVSALIAEPDDIEGFANKMVWILEHPQEAMVIGKEGTRIAMNSFQYKIEAKKIIDVIFK